MPKAEKRVISADGFQSICEQLPGMVAIYSIKTGEYSYVNSAITKILGYKPEDFTKNGLPFVAGLVHPDDLPKIMYENQAALKKANKNSTKKITNEPIVSFQYRMRHKKGHWVWLHTDGSVFSRKNGGVESVLNLSIDITEHKKEESRLNTTSSSTLQKLKHTDERYQAFIQNSHEGIWRFEVEKPISTKLSPNRQIKLMYKYAYLAEANEALAHMYGIKSTKELLGARLGDMMIESDPQNIDYLTAFIESGYSLNGAESHETDVNGNDKYFLNSLVGYIEKDHLVRAWGTQLDVTNQHQIADQLKSSEDMFRTLADTAPVLIWLADTENLGTYFNQTWLDFTGRTLKQELGIGWTESVHPDDIGKAATYCQTCFDARKEFKMEFRLKRADGEYRTMLDHGIPRYDGKGNFLGYIGSCIDIEDRKIAEKLKIKTAVLDAEHKELLAINAAKDEFIALASHQLRTPATGVKQYLGMLLEGYAGELKLTRHQRNLLKTAYQSNERQLIAINDLLIIAQIDADKRPLHKEKIDVFKLIKFIIAEQQNKLVSKQQKILLKSKINSAVLRADPSYLQMAIDNLIDNASKYSYDGSQITISLEQTDHRFVIKITDEGVGIAKENFEKLFQKFSRLDNPLSISSAGTGLGLYIVKKIIDAHDGNIKVKSRLGKSTTFIVEIPIKKV